VNLKDIIIPSQFSKSDIIEAYIFGSTAKNIDGHDRDIALFIRSNHPSFIQMGNEYNLYNNNLEYHVLPYNDQGKSIFYAMLEMKDYKYGTGKGVAISVDIDENTDAM